MLVEQPGADPQHREADEEIEGGAQILPEILVPDDGANPQDQQEEGGPDHQRDVALQEQGQVAGTLGSRRRAVKRLACAVLRAPLTSRTRAAIKRECRSPMSRVSRAQSRCSEVRCARGPSTTPGCSLDRMEWGRS